MASDIVPVPKGFSFSAIDAGFKYSGRDDLMLIVSETEAAATGVFTQNAFQAAPVLVAKANLAKAGGRGRAILVNAGQANACTGEDGMAACRQTLKLVAESLGMAPREVLPASTGVIGARMDMEKWAAAVPRLVDGLGQAGPSQAARAIMTTDTFPKLAWSSLSTASGEVRVLGMAKGSGMIAPNMATMIGVLLCDADVGSLWWHEAVAACADKSFNSVTVDGDTSTNDCVLALANGASRVKIDSAEGRQDLLSVMMEVCQTLAYMIVQDAEGGTKIIRIKVKGAKDHAQAELAARAVGHSPLVKTAMFGEDANWGRIVCAIGRSGAEFDPGEVSVAVGGVPVFSRGMPSGGDLDGLLAPHMRRGEIPVDIELGDGPGRYVLLASDLSYDYVKINADYRS
ncbi:bifunctional glutamate N-acetyltransferase/amino-acid acetyltransferase ArgJ [Desulfolutivibrio sulfoxidireducens]|uniref:bifunctional glutamate N-acetyltransferase/amino-acid acetyltransferase ArgJ n=1 Tax=Desulfolutivibrio sulfoxidireducens TaxID=2773299 RepID=UPI00159DE8A7|nr:bifunctional glutamate N-acetyltransferase/amino-acid acetyltransferase ArgJ [Desulfolutivibrio sulfoxidireducens]QLA20996.1 bifunctional glutamate N-acetyltransferase/amino-acid acetyltransferase ArgJ [Desulfolutivibrio sulfoxidireducens]